MESHLLFAAWRHWIPMRAPWWSWWHGNGAIALWDHSCTTARTEKSMDLLIIQQNVESWWIMMKCDEALPGVQEWLSFDFPKHPAKLYVTQLKVFSRVQLGQMCPNWVRMTTDSHRFVPGWHSKKKHFLSCFMQLSIKSEKQFFFTNPSDVAANSFHRQAAPQDLQVAAGLVSETVRGPSHRRVDMTLCCPIV